MSRYYIEGRDEGFGAWQMPKFGKSSSTKKTTAQVNAEIKRHLEEQALIVELHNVEIDLQRETDDDRRAHLEEEARRLNTLQQEAQWEAEIQAQIDAENIAADAVEDQIYGPTTVGSQECSPGLVWDGGAGLCVPEGGAGNGAGNGAGMSKAPFVIAGVAALGLIGFIFMRKKK